MKSLTDASTKLTKDIANLKQAVIDGQVCVIQWVVGVFIGAIVIVLSVGSLYISAPELLK